MIICWVKKSILTTLSSSINFTTALFQDEFVDYLKVLLVWQYLFDFKEDKKYIGKKIYICSSWPRLVNAQNQDIKFGISFALETKTKW